LAVTLVDGNQRVPLPIVTDTTEGLLRTGVLLLDVSGLSDSPRSFSIELRAPRGFERAPRVTRIEPNVLPIVQGRTIHEEAHGSIAGPDWSFQLEESGLQFTPGQEPVVIELREGDTTRRVPWRRCENLSEAGPRDAVYEFDSATGQVTFGNGVNGQIPPAGTTLLATYSVSDGEQGNVAANRKWQVAGFVGSFGMNPDPMSGGAAQANWIDERRQARHRAREDHALVSASDLVSAALALPLLEVARAWVLPPTQGTPRTGVVTLVAMRARSSQEGEADTPETPRWLEAIRSRLLPKMPLGSRLILTAPQYVQFSLRATVEAAPGRDPTALLTAIKAELTGRLALTGPTPRQPGVPVASRDLVAWIRSVDGVRQVSALALVLSSGAEVDEVSVPHDGLPSLELAGSVIEVKGAGSVGQP